MANAAKDVRMLVIVLSNSESGITWFYMNLDA